MRTFIIISLAQNAVIKNKFLAIIGKFDYKFDTLDYFLRQN